MYDTAVWLRRAFTRVALGALVALPLACGADTADGDAAAKMTSDVAAEPSMAAEPVQVATAEGAKPYEVECAANAEGVNECTVDKDTFIGWRTYHAFCHVCHAQDAVGSTFAPSLVDRMTQIDKERFLYTVSEGYTGQIGVMPAWKDNPNISKRYEELYAYLMARADGVLAPGRPKKKKVPR